MVTQTESILAALRVGPITPVEALERYGCFRLAARVADLRTSGFVIETERITRNGKTFAQYRLVKEAL